VLGLIGFLPAHVLKKPFGVFYTALLNLIAEGVNAQWAIRLLGIPGNVFAIIPVGSSKNPRVEQARLWDELDRETDPYFFEFVVLHNERPDADHDGPKWWKPCGDWLEFDLTPDQYSDLMK
jgi:hypothetical protein